MEGIKQRKRFFIMSIHYTVSIDLITNNNMK